MGVRAQERAFSIRPPIVPTPVLLAAVEGPLSFSLRRSEGGTAQDVSRESQGGCWNATAAAEAGGGAVVNTPVSVAEKTKVCLCSVASSPRAFACDTRRELPVRSQASCVVPSH